MRIIFFLLCITYSFSASAQILYSGTIGQYPIELQAEISTGNGTGVYLYKSTNIPIALSCTLTGSTWTLTEKNKRGIASAYFTFNSFDTGSTTITGIWKDIQSGKELPVTLHKQYNANEYGEGNSWDNRTIIQLESLKNIYFRAILKKDKDSYYPTVKTIQLMDKKTGRLLQQFEVDCQERGFYCVSSGDYNFDNLSDFSVFSQSYAGPNVSSLYYLYDPARKKYVASEIGGISLDFDAATKTVTETNQSGAGRYMQITRYKIVKNKMVQLSSKEYEWDDTQQDLIEKKKPARKH